MANNYSVTVSSDLKFIGYTEDGERQYGEVYFVIVENGAGRRWRTRQTWSGLQRVADDDGSIWFRDMRDTAVLLANGYANGVRKRLATGLKLVAGQWDEMSPAYGSRVWEREADLWLAPEI